MPCLPKQQDWAGVRIRIFNKVPSNQCCQCYQATLKITALKYQNGHAFPYRNPKTCRQHWDYQQNRVARYLSGITCHLPAQIFIMKWFHILLVISLTFWLLIVSTIRQTLVPTGDKLCIISSLKSVVVKPIWTPDNFYLTLDFY